MAGAFYCATLVEAVRRDPQCDSERVTEAMRWDALELREESGDWVRVAIVDQLGYKGWVPRASVREGSVVQANAVVVDPLVPLSLAGSPPGPCSSGLWMGTRVELVDVDGVLTTILGPDGERYSVASRRVLPLAEASAGSAPGDTVVARARALLGTPYLWGGMTLRGIDCSGLVHIAHRSTGTLLTRDADMQFEEGTPVERQDVRPGDAAFFRSERGISHTAIMLDADRIVHAQGASSSVVEGSLSEPWNSEHLAGFRRYV